MKIELTIELDPYDVAFLIAEGFKIMAEWNESELLTIINSIRDAVNKADPETKSKIAKEFQNGIYHQSDFDKWRGKDGILQPVEKLT